MRCLSHILLYTLLSSTAARAGPLSRSERLRRAYLDISEEEAITLAVHARQEVDDGTTPTPIFSTIVPDTPESSSSPPPSSETAGNGDAYREDDGSSTSSLEANPPSSQAPEPDTSSSAQSEPPSTSNPDAAETDAPVPSSEQAFLPPISSRISVPASLRSSQAVQDPSSLVELSSATPEVTPSTTLVTESQISEPPLESSTEAIGAPSDNGAGNEGSLTPSPIFTTISAGPATTEESLSFASTLQLPIGERSTTVAKSEVASSTVADELPVSTALTPSVEPSTSIIQPSEPQQSAPATESLLSSTLPVGNSSRPAASITRSITDTPLFTTTVGIPSASRILSPSEVAPSSSAVEETLPAASSALPVSTTPASAIVTAPEITPTGEPDLQVPTNRGPPNPSATSSISPERFQVNLEQAKAFHDSFKPLTEQSACFGQQAACINGGIAQCSPDQGRFVITSCNDPSEKCFPLPLVFEDGVKLSCTDPVEARRILGVEEDDSSSALSTTPSPSTTPSGDQVVTVTEQPTVTKIIATETVISASPSGEQVVTVTERPTVTEIVATETIDNGQGTPSASTGLPQSPSATSPAEGVVTVTETPTVTLVVTQTVDQPGTEETSAPPLEITTTVGGGILTLTTFITFQPPPPEPTEPSTTQFITVTITALPSRLPETQTDVIEVPQPTSSAQPGTGGGSGDDGRGDENDNDGNGDDDDGDDGDDEGDDPVLTSLNIIIIPTTLLTTTIRATPAAAEQALAAPVDDAAPTVTTTVTEIVSVPVMVTVTQREVRIEKATVTATVTQAA